MKKILFVFATAGILYACSATRQSMQPGSAATYSAVGRIAKMYTTASGTTQRLDASGNYTFAAKGQPVESDITVFVDPSHQFQTYVGTGGALTDASAEVFYKMPKAVQQEILTAYFDKTNGIGYSIARTNMASCDFSSDMYEYVSNEDINLTTFNIEHDRKYKLPFIKEAMQAAGGKLNVFVSPWSPPAWMKTNNDRLHGGHLKEEYYQPWADYFVKFIRSFEQEGVPVWAASIQNEPMATQRWESCVFSADEETKFLGVLGSTFEKAGLKDKKIIVWDHNRDLMYQRAQNYFSSPNAKYAWGIGFHWYENWSGGSPMFENVAKVHEAFPGKQILFTEGCNEQFTTTRLNDWKLGERYGLSMINDYNNGMSGFTDWNIVLDENGGPNHVGNFCFAPLHANVKTGKLMYTNAFYYIGHFSKFLQPGAKRIISSATRSQLKTTAFQNPDGTLVVVVMNDTDMDTIYDLFINGQATKLAAKPHSISTIVI